MEALHQFHEFATNHYEILKNYPEFHDAQNIYSELTAVQKKLYELEQERRHHHIRMGLPAEKL